MSLSSHNLNFFHGKLRAASGRLFWLGLLMVVVGIAAIAFPEFGTVAAIFLVGWVLLVSGVATLISSFWIHGTTPFFAANLLGLLSAAAGVFLLLNPLAGALALTLVLGAMLIIQGAAELMFALEARPAPGWVGMLVSGIASIALAVIIASGWPHISRIALGILLGINFISTGAGYIALSRGFKA